MRCPFSSTLYRPTIYLPERFTRFVFHLAAAPNLPISLSRSALTFLARAFPPRAARCFRTARTSAFLGDLMLTRYTCPLGMSREIHVDRLATCSPERHHRGDPVNPRTQIRSWVPPPLSERQGQNLQERLDASRDRA